MAILQFAAFLAIITLAIGSSSVAANFTIPFLSSTFGDEACKTDVCGKGNCVASSSNAFGFECQCQKGWKQSRPDDDQFLKFLPCIIPNCSVNFNCANAPDPAPNVKQSNYSVFDCRKSFLFADNFIQSVVYSFVSMLVACSWTDCGGGSCNKTSLFTHSCVCEEGYYNLLNSSSFPCYKECSIGGDCVTLGIGIMNSSNPSPPRSTSVASDNESHASSLIIGVEFSWLITMVATLAHFLWKYS